MAWSGLLRGVLAASLVGAGTAQATPARRTPPGQAMPPPAVLLASAVPARWQPDCAAGGCQPSVTLKADDARTLLRVWIGHAAGGEPFMGVLAPLGIHLPSAVRLSFDGGRTQPVALTVTDCSALGCRAVTPYTAALAARLARTADLTVLARDARTRTVMGFRVPLDGFADSLVPGLLRR